MNAYILGAGPQRLTVVVDYNNYGAGVFEEEAANRGMTEEEALEKFRRLFEDTLEGTNEHVVHYAGDGIYGRELVLFVGPGSNHSTETWEIFSTWDVQRQEEDGTVVAVHPLRNIWQRLRPEEYQTHKAKLEMTLSNFTQAVTAANNARITE